MLFGALQVQSTNAEGEMSVSPGMMTKGFIGSGQKILDETGISHHKHPISHLQIQSKASNEDTSESESNRMSVFTFNILF